jgi:hypothetical protein
MPHYRVPFFSLLSEKLSEKDVDLSVYYGRERSGTVPVTTKVYAPWAEEIENKYYNIGDFEVVSQNVPRKVYDTDLVIVEQ